MALEKPKSRLLHIMERRPRSLRNRWITYGIWVGVASSVELCNGNFVIVNVQFLFQCVHILFLLFGLK